jgi:hypothetical protein
MRILSNDQVGSRIILDGDEYIVNIEINEERFHRVYVTYDVDDAKDVADYITDKIKDRFNDKVIDHI